MTDRTRGTETPEEAEQRRIDAAIPKHEIAQTLNERFGVDPDAILADLNNAPLQAQLRGDTTDDDERHRAGD